MKLKSKGVLHYFLEVVAIVLGITISFMVDEWREDRQEHSEYVSYLTKMRKDLRSDSLIRSVIIPQRDSQFVTSLKLYNVIYGSDTMKDSKVFIESLASSFRSHPVTVRDNTFQELQSSGKLRLIKNDSIRMLILIYYDSPTKEVWNETLKIRNYVVLDKVVENLPLEIFLEKNIDAEKNKESVTNINYDVLKHKVINQLHADQQFEGIFKNSIRTLEALANLEKDWRQLNIEIMKNIDEELAKE